MKQILEDTHTVDCTWMRNVHLTDHRFCRYDDALALHCIRISDFTAYLPALKALLNEKEILRADNYLMAKDATRFTVARGMLKCLLGSYLNRPAADIEFHFEENLKPVIRQTGKPIHFNVSHSGDMVLIAVSTAPVGVDVEYIDADFSYEQVLDVTFSEKELRFIRNSNNRTEAFFLLWTRKEALLKATGKGIDDHLPNVPSLDGRHAVLSEFTNSDLPWRTGSFGLGADYVASLAFNPEFPIEPVVVYRADTELLKG
jgi:4'-phosphopantetheinyl transferase